MQFGSGISWAEGKFLQKTLSYLLCQRLRFPWLSLATQLKDYLMYNNGLIDQSIQKWLPRDFLAILSMWWGKTIDLKIIIIIIIKSIGKTHQVNKSEISEKKMPVCQWYDLWDNQNNKIHDIDAILAMVIMRWMAQITLWIKKNLIHHITPMCKNL